MVWMARVMADKQSTSQSDLARSGPQGLTTLDAFGAGSRNATAELVLLGIL